MCRITWALIRFNNLLTSILGNASLLELHWGRSPKLAAIIEASEKAAALTQQLLAYAGKGQVQISDFDVAQLVDSSADILRVDRRLPAVESDLNRRSRGTFQSQYWASDRRVRPGHGVIAPLRPGVLAAINRTPRAGVVAHRRSVQLELGLSGLLVPRCLGRLALKKRSWALVPGEAAEQLSPAQV